MGTLTRGHCIYRYAHRVSYRGTDHHSLAGLPLRPRLRTHQLVENIDTLIIRPVPPPNLDILSVADLHKSQALKYDL